MARSLHRQLNKRHCGDVHWQLPVHKGYLVGRLSGTRLNLPGTSAATEAQPTLVTGIRPLRKARWGDRSGSCAIQVAAVASESWREEANRSGFVPGSPLAAPVRAARGRLPRSGRDQVDPVGRLEQAHHRRLQRQFRLHVAAGQVARDRAPRNRRLSVPKACSTTQHRRATRRLNCFCRTPSGCPRDARYMIPDFRPAALRCARLAALARPLSGQHLPRRAARHQRREVRGFSCAGRASTRSTYPSPSARMSPFVAKETPAALLQPAGTGSADSRSVTGTSGAASSVRSSASPLHAGGGAPRSRRSSHPLPPPAPAPPSSRSAPASGSPRPATTHRDPAGSAPDGTGRS